MNNLVKSSFYRYNCKICRTNTVESNICAFVILVNIVKLPSTDAKTIYTATSMYGSGCLSSISPILCAINFFYFCQSPRLKKKKVSCSCNTHFLHFE